MRKGVLSAFVAGLAALVAMLAVLPAAALAVEFGADPSEGPAGLPNGRVYEEVSPAVKYGGEAGYSAGAKKLLVSPLYSVASPSGESLLYTENGAFGETSSGLDLFGVARRAPGGGWTNEAALPPVASEPNGITDMPYFFDPSTNLRQFAFTSGKPYISGENAKSEAGVDQTRSPNLYLTAETSGNSVEPTWLSRPLVETIEPALGEMGGEPNITIAGASPDLSRVYFTYLGTLMKEDEPRIPYVAKDHATGFYEWSGGKLQEAGVLPNGQLDPFGASPAAVEAGNYAVQTAEYSNQVAAEGQRAFFVSPSPYKANIEACEAAQKAGQTIPGGCVPQIYARIHEGSSTREVLVSRDELAGGAPAPTEVHGIRGGYSGTTIHAYAAPDGSRVFFRDNAALTQAAKEAEEAGEAQPQKAYEDNLEARGGEGEVVYRPDLVFYNRGLTGSILATSANATSMLLEYRPLEEERVVIAYWHLNAGQEELVPIAETPGYRPQRVESARSTSDGSVFVFATEAPLTAPAGSKGAVTQFNEAGKYNEVYRYVPGSGGGTLSCLSCKGTAAPAGPAKLSNDDEEGDRRRLVSTRAMNAQGTQVFFDSPERLVNQAVNHTRNVYEWQAQGTGGCAAEGGCVYLISSGTSPRESFLLDNSENGNNVFFATTAALSPEDREGGYDVYDARVSEGGTPVVSSNSSCASQCQEAEAPAGLPRLLTSAVGASGNLIAQAGQTQQKKGSSAKKGVGKRNEVRKRKLARCRKQARKRKGRRKRKHALRRCHRRFGAKAARRHVKGHKHHGAKRRRG